jgi:L-amino acid N-acyltransferase YncA
MLYIRPMRDEDWTAVHKIFQDGIDTGLASLNTEAGDFEDFNRRYLKTCRFVAEKNGVIAGWTALYPYSSREVYKGVANLSVYIGQDFRSQGIGILLLRHLIIHSEQAGFWTLHAGIFPENKASIHIHAKAGFRKVGYFERIGQRNGRWYDTVIMEKRSKQV